VLKVLHDTVKGFFLPNPENVLMFGKTTTMTKEIVNDKKDVITLNGAPDEKNIELKIDMVADELKIYFSDHEYVCRVHLARNGPRHIDEVINNYLKAKKKCIVNYDTDHFFSKHFFNVLFVTSKSEIKDYPLLEARYDYTVILDEKKSDKDTAQEIVVAWGCWIQDRKITKPL